MNGEAAPLQIKQMEAIMYYILNKETGRIQLINLSKEDYQGLEPALKKEVSSYFMFSRTVGCWVSKSTKNHYSAVRICHKLGFETCETINERLSYEEQLEVKAQKAENRAERYEKKSEKLLEECENLQGDFNGYRGDIAFMTQPNIQSSKGRSFTNYRNRILARYEKSFDVYRKSEEYKKRAETAKHTAENSRLNDLSYLSNRITACTAAIKKCQKNERYDTMEEYVDKLAFFQNRLEEIGGTVYSKKNIKVGDLVKIRNYYRTVVKCNPTTVIVDTNHGFTLSYKYSEIEKRCD
jgi:hypothetical protein